MSKFEIIKREGSIFVKSTISNSFPELVDILTKDKEFPFLSQNEYDVLDIEMKNFLYERFNNMFSVAAKEWDVLKYGLINTNPHIKCQLCGHNPLKNISIIRNKITKEELVVGSSCIDKYREFTGIHGESIKELQKNSYKLKNEHLLEQKSSGILRDFTRLKTIKQEMPLLRKDLERTLEKLNIELQAVEKSISSKSISKTQLNKIASTHDKVKEFLVKFDEYLYFSENNTYGINKDIVNWLFKRDFDYDLFNQLKQDGKITVDTISSINEPKFMRKIIPLFKENLAKNGYHFAGKLKNNRFPVIYKEWNNVILNVDNKEFIKKYKMYLFINTEQEIDLRFIINISKIVDSYSMRNSLEYILDEEFTKIYSFHYDDNQIDELAFKNNKSNKILVVNYSDFVNKFLKYIYGLDSKNKCLNLITYLNNESVEYSKSDYDDHIKKISI